MVVALLSNGHILLEGAPGTAKTLLVRCFAAATGLKFGRIQFTPDLMPGDIIGANLFDFQTSKFTLKKGPVFCDFLLADEINRTPPKTQAALLEAMQEASVTIDGKSHSLGENFTVIATQNPIEQQGTYPLPEAQLDRFLFKHLLNYPSREQEMSIVSRHGKSSKSPAKTVAEITSVIKPKDLKTARKHIEQVAVTDEIISYIVDLVRNTRENPEIEIGASPRSASMLAVASRVYAALYDREFVIPDDVKHLALPLLRHRVILSPSAEIEGLTTDEVLNSILEQLPAPR
ncbi:MAG: MoxR family ATPase [Robiginitomaculum sp.]|nr:MoxR family ATPase [Robiginitomaculum sp.]